LPWSKTREDRQRDARVYQDPLYLRNRPVIMARANGRCECPGDCGGHEGPCGRRDRRLQCDHIRNVAATGYADHSLGNLRAVCSGPGSCHALKTAQEGGGYRNPRSADPASIQRTRW